MVERCKQGNPKAQYELYSLYAKAMYNTALRIVKFAEEAEDVLQEAFLDAFTKLDSFRADSTFGAWLKTIVVNKALGKLKQKRQFFEELNESHFNQSEEDYSGQEDFDVSQVQKIKKGIFDLPDGYRLILSLYLFEGYDHGEIAEIMGIKESTSRSQFLRGKQKLLASLSV
ncbi:RNA polymerase sigma factor [Lacihabitans lacunae]|uniref:RNA polymerase sigma factor n=1 Tax=Lacihabitans lacunae TaxID=1028214 RepID=A0ABV7YTX3_9BACT